MAEPHVEHGQTRKLGELKPHPRNSRTHSDAQIEQIMAAMGEWDWTIPMLIDDKGVILAGHGRQLAGLKKWGPDHEVPVSIARGWSEAKKRAYIIADNRLTESGGWDANLLRAEMMELQGVFPDLSPLGFTKLELAELLAVPKAWNTDPDDVPDAPSTPVSQSGDLWILGNHRIICGDSTDRETVVRVLAGAKPHLMVTDPPYGVEYDPSWRAKAGVNKNKAKMGKVLNDDRADWREARALFPGDVAYVWHASLFTREVLNSLEACGFKHRSMIIWAKDRFTLGRADYHWQHEPCWYVVRDGKTGHYVGGRRQSTVWNIAARDDSGVGHSTQKPIECMKRPIENNSNPGDGVYEPFSGSGTTIIAAEMTGRKCYAIELSPAYVDIAVTRWQAFTGLKATNENGDTFADVAASRAITQVTP